MNRSTSPLRLVAVALLLPVITTGCALSPGAVDPVAADGSQSPHAGAFHTGHYPNLFADLLGKSQKEIDAKVELAWQKLFHGDAKNERVYYPVGDDQAYMHDIGSDDVRSEGISYGMMIAVQMDKQEEFDRLWTWAKVHMYHEDGPHHGFFAWHATTDGEPIDHNSASDGEVWIATALFFAAGRWGNGEGIYDYESEAQALLHTMLHKAEEEQTEVTNMFDAESKLVTFVPEAGRASEFTDPSYQVPHYYELWARWADEDQEFWAEAALASREFLHRSSHPETALNPDYAEFDGSPADPWDEGHDTFRYDAFRVAMNVGVDWSWFAADPWQVEQSNRLLEFFAAQGIDSYVNLYEIDGTPLSEGRSLGLIAMNAVAALAADSDVAPAFVEALWDLEPPTGRWRYYDGLLYMLALLQTSGEFRIWEPATAEAG